MLRSSFQDGRTWFSFKQIDPNIDGQPADSAGKRLKAGKGTGARDTRLMTDDFSLFGLIGQFKRMGNGESCTETM